MNKNFNEIFTELRKNNNMTQASCAGIFNVTKSTISGWETGRNEPNIDMLKKIANFFNVSIDFLTGIEEIDGTIVNEFERTHIQSKINSVIVFNYYGIEHNYSLSQDLTNALITILNQIK